MSYTTIRYQAGGRDAVRRHHAATPEGVWFKKYAEEHGFHEAVAWRDSGRPIPGSKTAKAKH